MKKLSSLAVVLMAILIAACGRKPVQEVNGDTDETITVEDSLRMALANQDSLLALLNDINDDIATIKQMEDIMTNPAANLNQESESMRERISNDMLAIRQTLQRRREQVAELEKKLNASYGSNATLKRTIENLQGQIATLEGTVASLNETLAQKNIIINRQAEEIDSLSYTLTAVNEAKDVAEEQNIKLTDDLNTCYFTIGTKKQLNDNGIIKSGFLRKTKILPGDVDPQFFTKADRRSLLEINCHSKKAEVLTNQPESSYEFISEANGDKILVIKNADEFWKKSPFLVIKTD